MSHVYEGINDLATMAPNLALEWHPTRNGNLTPNMVAHGSKQKVWWLGKCGHEWEAVIHSRYLGRGCPYCSGKSVLEGFNDLASKAPTLVDEWDQEKNKELTPKNVTVRSHAKVWWKCSICGFEWQATVKARVNGTRCPACYKRNRTSFPEQAFYYYVHLCYPDAVSGFSEFFEKSMELDIYIPSKKIGIEYDGYHWHKASQLKTERKKYQICKANEIDLIRIKEIAEEESVVDNCDYSITISSRYNEEELDRAICALNEIFSLETDIDVERDRIKILQQYYSVVRENSITNKAPQLVNEWHPTKNGSITPDMVHGGSNQKVWWKCSSCGHEWTAIVCNRVKGSGCPACARKQFEKARIDSSIAKNGSFAEMQPELLSEWDYELNSAIDPEGISVGSNKKAWWKCSKCGNEWQAAIINRVNGSGCPICQKKKQIESYKKTKLKKKGSLVETHPEIAAEWHPTKNVSSSPTEIIASTKQTFWWICSVCNHEWQATVYSRVRGSGCPECQKKAQREVKMQQSVIRNGSLKETCPELAKEWHSTKNYPLTPDLVSKGSNQKVWWKCSKCGYEWKAQIQNRAKGTGCPECGKNKQLLSFQKSIVDKKGSLKETCPSLVPEWDTEKNLPLTPDLVSKGSNKKVWWKCSKCGYNWEAVVYSRSMGHGCPNCYKKSIKNKG